MSPIRLCQWVRLPWCVTIEMAMEDSEAAKAELCRGNLVRHTSLGGVEAGPEMKRRSKLRDWQKPRNHISLTLVSTKFHLGGLLNLA